MDLRAAARTLVESIQNDTDEIVLLPSHLIDQYTTQVDTLKLLNLFEYENRLQSDVLVGVGYFL